MGRSYQSMAPKESSMDPTSSAAWPSVEGSTLAAGPSERAVRPWSLCRLLCFVVDANDLEQD